MNKKSRATPSLTVEHWNGEINAMLSSIATSAAGWLAPLPEAAMTTRAIIKVFELPSFWAMCVAVSIELVGVSVNSHYLSVEQFNAELEADRVKRNNAKNPKVPPADLPAAKRAVNWYYVITGAIVGLTAIYEVLVEHAPPIKLLAILFPFASAIGTKTLNRRAALHRKQAAMQDGGKKEKATQPETPESLPLLRKEEIKTESVLPDYASMDSKSAILTFYKASPKASQQQAAQAVGVSRQRVGQILTQLENEKAIKRNGSGVKVIAQKPNPSPTGARW